jgi:hypothetical protein
MPSKQEIVKCEFACLCAALCVVIPGRAKREPGISRYNLEIPGLVLRTIPE